MLKLVNIKKDYGKFNALKNINIEFTNGIYGLLAPNGAGKTTLIKMNATLYFPTEGYIEYNGVNIFTLDENYRDLIGYLPQDFGCYGNYSAEKFLLY